VAARGGLHVILTEYNDAKRIDRQLVGRSARQGDPGSAEVIVALDDELFASHAPRLVAWVRAMASARGQVSRPVLAMLQWVAQGQVERIHREARENTIKQDRRLVQMLSFSGRGE
jgi:preprotein translocase subunit SecA